MCIQEEMAAERRQEVQEMQAQGMSTRAIAEQVGVSPMQVSNDLRSSTVNPFTVDAAPAQLPSPAPAQPRQQQIVAWLRDHGPPMHGYRSLER